MVADTNSGAYFDLRTLEPAVHLAHRVADAGPRLAAIWNDSDGRKDPDRVFAALLGLYSPLLPLHLKFDTLDTARRYLRSYTGAWAAAALDVNYSAYLAGLSTASVTGYLAALPDALLADVDCPRAEVERPKFQRVAAAWQTAIMAGENPAVSKRQLDRLRGAVADLAEFDWDTLNVARAWESLDLHLRAKL